MPTGPGAPSTTPRPIIAASTASSSAMRPYAGRADRAGPIFSKTSVTADRQDGTRHPGDVTDQDQTEIKSCFEHSLSRPSSVSPPWYLRKAVLLLKAGGAPSTAVAARIADSTHTDSVARTSEVLGALADGICRGGDERPQRTGRSDVEPSSCLVTHHSCARRRSVVWDRGASLRLGASIKGSSSIMREPTHSEGCRTFLRL